MGLDQSLPLKRLSWKLATLFAITCPKRASSITSLDLNNHRVLPEEVGFTLTVPTKGTRPDETVQGFFTRCPSEARLCPVNCFEQYLASTKDLGETQQ